MPIIVSRGTDPFRVLLFGLTFVAFGVNTRFALLKQYRLWNLFAAYGLALLIIIALAYMISTSFFPAAPPRGQWRVGGLLAHDDSPRRYGFLHCRGFLQRWKLQVRMRRLSLVEVVWCTT
ncbi:MAG: hypothetical protein QW677_08995 [Pyrobaculum sp.]|uniref:hypothetical protein n=1 Tax=Pyrobaculum sp. TaxID=2004705 RepID=UPI00315E0AB7